jgi:hypothetical protein
MSKVREALLEAQRLTTGAGNGTWTRQRPPAEWQRLYALFSEALAETEADRIEVDGFTIDLTLGIYIEEGGSE